MFRKQPRFKGPGVGTLAAVCQGPRNGIGERPKLINNCLFPKWPDYIYDSILGKYPKQGREKMFWKQLRCSQI